MNERKDEAEITPPVDFAKDEDVSQAVRRAVREALAGHARRGNRVVVWKDGHPVWIRPTPELGA
ncbi:hypothetical protein EON79_17030 [bacterium]|nr:MAG: hypothetical protein EON79_17030 [bacterium]